MNLNNTYFFKLDKSGDCKLNHAILKRWTSSILKRYIDESDSSGMQLVFVVQTLVAKLQHPKGLDSLADNGIQY